MADGAIEFSTRLDNSQLEKDLRAAEKKVDELKRKLEEKESDRNAIAEQMEDARIEVELTEKSIERLKARYEELKAADDPSNLPEMTNIHEQLMGEYKELGKQQGDYGKLAEKYKAADAEVSDYTDKLKAAEAEEAKLSEQAKGLYTDKDGNAYASRMEKVRGAVRSVGATIARAAVTVLTVIGPVIALVAKAVDAVKSVVLENETVKAQLAQIHAITSGFTNYVAAAVTPIVVGALRVIITMLMTLARLIDSVFGTKFVESIRAAQAAQAAQAKATDKQAKATKKLATQVKKATRELLAFDELNVLSADDQNAAADNVPDVGDGGGAPDTAAGAAPLVNGIDAALGEIMFILGAALMAVGAILCFSGINIPLGLALMAIGALMVYTAAQEAWDKLPQEVRDAINAMLVITGLVMLVLGVILVFTGVGIPIGVGLIAAGALLLFTAVQLNWEYLPAEVQGVVTALMLVLSAALLVIGVILCFTGVGVGLGIGLMILGAAGLAATAALNWSKLPEDIQNTVSIIMLIIGAALLVIGVILCFTGVALPLGVALMVAGAALLVANAAVNWNKLPDEVKAVITALLGFIGAALLAIGVILCVTGVGIPLGIACILIGVGMIVAAVALNWGRMSDETKDFLTKILAVVGGALLVIGIILCLTGVGIPIGIACILIGIASLVAAVALNWNFIVDKLKEVWGAITAFWDRYIAPVFTTEWWENLFRSIINGLTWAINAGLNAFGAFVNWIGDGITGVLDFFGIDVGGSLHIEMPQIPYLAEGAVIPPNRRFMAVLGDQTNGTNLEAPEGLIRQIVREEAGGGAEMLGVMYDLLDAVRAGSTIYVDRHVLGQTVASEMSSMTRMSGV